MSYDENLKFTPKRANTEKKKTQNKTKTKTETEKKNPVRVPYVPSIFLPVT